MAAAGTAAVIGGIAAVPLVSGARTPPTVLDIASTQRQVEQILRDPLEGYGAGVVTGVVCNGGVNPAVEAGREIICEAVVDGTPRRVAVVFREASGTYAVDRPR